MIPTRLLLPIYVWSVSLRVTVVTKHLGFVAAITTRLGARPQEDRVGIHRSFAVFDRTPRRCKTHLHAEMIIAVDGVFVVRMFLPKKEYTVLTGSGDSEAFAFHQLFDVGYEILSILFGGHQLLPFSQCSCRQVAQWVASPAFKNCARHTRRSVAQLSS